MASIGSRQKVRLFIEGMEVPFQSATIHSQIGSPVSATIYLVPLNEIKFIRPRTQVSLFMRDPKNFPDDDYYLVFEGDVIGRTMSKQQDSRSFAISAIDYSSYWHLAKVYTLSPNYTVGKIEDTISFQDGVLADNIKALGGQKNQTSSTPTVPIIQKILSKGRKDLVAGVVDVIKTLAGAEKGQGANQFFAAAFDRLRITDRMNLFTSQKLESFLQDLEVQQFLEDFNGKFGGITSLSDLLYPIMHLVFHDFVSIPFPSYIKPAQVDGNGGIKVQNSQTVSTNEKFVSTGRVLSHFFFVPDGYSLPAPMCNVVFPNQQRGFSFSDDFNATATRYMFRASEPLVTSPGGQAAQYPTQYYPTCFSDFMFKPPRKATESEINSYLGPSTLLTAPGTGNSYYQLYYGDPDSKAVGPTAGVGDQAIRESDYLSNEESLKGIFLDTDTFIPSYTALTKGASAEARTKFIQSIGAYMFFKKRFSARQCQADLIFNPFLVPGFNALFLDDSAAGQSFIAKVQSVTHNLSNDGCATLVDLGYGRDFDEVDEVTGGSGDPPVPDWFDKDIFGKIDVDLFKQETSYLKSIGAIDTAEANKRDKIANPTVFKNLDLFYQALLGCNATTHYDSSVTAEAIAANSGAPIKGKPQIVSTRGAVSYLLHQYKQVASNRAVADDKVKKLIYRPLAPLIASFDFLGASLVGKGRIVPNEFAVFDGGRFGGVGHADEKAVAFRRSVISAYVKQLRTRVGFRG